MKVHVLVHEVDGVMGVFADAAAAKRSVYSRGQAAWAWVESLRWWRNGDYRIQEEELQ